MFLSVCVKKVATKCQKIRYSLFIPISLLDKKIYE